MILATPSYVAAELLAPVDPPLGEQLGRIEHSGTAIVSLGFDRGQIGHPMRGAGAVVPGVEKSPILAISFSSHKYPHRAPEGKAILRVFVGGARAPEMAEMADERLLPLVLGEVRRLLRITGEPVYASVAHWPRTMPQYHVGHKRLVAQIEARVAESARPGASRQRLSRRGHPRLHPRRRAGRRAGAGESIIVAFRSAKAARKERYFRGAKGDNTTVCRVGRVERVPPTYPAHFVHRAVKSRSSPSMYERLKHSTLLGQGSS